MRLVIGLLIGFVVFETNAEDVQDTKPIRLIEFSMPDQFEKVHTHEELLGEPVLVLATEGASQKATQAWLDAIKAAFEADDDAEMVRVMPAPQLASIPELARGTIRKVIVLRDEPWMLLDWENRFSEAYGLKKGDAKFLVFDGEGVLMRKITGKTVDAGVVAEVVEELKVLENSEGVGHEDVV